MTRRRSWWLICLVIAGSCALPAQAWAQDPIHKFGRGVVNVLTGWIELPKQIHLGKTEDNPMTGVPIGLGKGVALTLLRTGIGLYEAVTFPLPYPHGFASPYEGISLPDYAWE